MEHFDNMPTFNKLKYHLLSLFRPNKRSIFGIHDPTGIRYLFQLRVRLSPLLSHKRHHNFIDTPSEICHCNQGVDDSNHFFFSCLSFITESATLVTNVNEILQKNNLNHLENQLQLYLYGQDFMNYADNRNILSSTIKYIKDTKRFSN